MANYTGSTGVTSFFNTQGNTANNIGNGIVYGGALQTGPNWAHTFIPATTFDTSSSGWANIQSLAIPGPGIWRVWANLRYKWSGGTQVASVLTTSSTGGSGEIQAYSGATGSSGTRNWRWCLEHPVANSFANMNISPEWIVFFPTGLSYPYTIYLQQYSYSSDSAYAIQNDSNGQSTFAAIMMNPNPGGNGTTIYCL
jgi:hypothetical protein